MAIEIVSKTRCFGGLQQVYKHLSSELNCSMKFAVYTPESEGNEKFNCLFFLSGLTCNEENFIQKSGFQKYANEKRLLVVGPDTSPRGCDLPGDKDSWDFGEGAGFYVDSLQEPWSKHYRMYSYVTQELPKIIEANFPVTGKFGIFGHSMGGHGAITIGLRNPEKFQSISAFAPICNPSNSPWGRDKTFKNYLGEDAKLGGWAQYDSTELAKTYQGPLRNILVDQGLQDDFLETHLMPNALKEAAATNANIELNLRMQEGYNHSYFFIASFIQDHINHHAKILNTV